MGTLGTKTPHNGASLLRNGIIQRRFSIIGTWDGTFASAGPDWLVDAWVCTGQAAQPNNN